MTGSHPEHGRLRSPYRLVDGIERSAFQSRVTAGPWSGTFSLRAALSGKSRALLSDPRSLATPFEASGAVATPVTRRPCLLRVSPRPRRKWRW